MSEVLNEVITLMQENLKLKDELAAYDDSRQKLHLSIQDKIKKLAASEQKVSELEKQNKAMALQRDDLTKAYRGRGERIKELEKQLAQEQAARLMRGGYE